METINWEAVSAISEALGLVVVVSSLIFVGFQIRQSAHATRAASMANIMDRLIDFYMDLSSNDNLAQIAWNSGQEPDVLEDIERWRFHMLFYGAFYAWHNAYYQWRIGAFDTKAWSSYKKLMINVLHGREVRDAWDGRKSLFPEDFQVYVEKEILDQPRDPNFKLPGDYSTG